MDRSIRNKLENIKSELQNVINDLEHLSNEVDANFAGIGNERCASALDKVADEYKHIKRKLNRIS